MARQLRLLSTSDNRKKRLTNGASITFRLKPVTVTELRAL